MEILDGVYYLLAGWRFLLLPGFRRRTLKRWNDQSGMEVMQEIVGGVTGVVVSILLPLFLWWQFR